MINGSLILEGGATRGVFTSGVLDYLMERDIYFSDVTGVSAGSCNAVGYVAKQPERTKKCMIHRGKEYNYYYGLKGFIKERSILDMDMIFDKMPNSLIPLDFDTYFHSGVHCEIVTTNCNTGKAEYLTEDSDPQRLMMMCRASSSMPLVCPIVNVDGIPYLDGGLADSVPIKHVKERGAKKIVIILTRKKGYRKEKISKAHIELYRKMYSKYPELVKTCILRNKRYNVTMNYIDWLEEKGEIFVIRPTHRPVHRIEKDTEKLEAFYEHGYETMEQKFNKMMKYLGS